MFLQQLILLFPNQEIRRALFIRPRILRSKNCLRFILFINFIISILLIIYIRSTINKYYAYQSFIQVYPFSTVSFWKDNRTINQKQLLPVRKIEDVNLSNATIAIGACCRTVRKHLVGFQRNLASITALFGQYRIYIYESDSYDSTLKFLRQWQKNDSDHVRVHSEGEQSRYVSSRKFYSLL